MQPVRLTFCSVVLEAAVGDGPPGTHCCQVTGYCGVSPVQFRDWRGDCVTTELPRLPTPPQTQTHTCVQMPRCLGSSAALWINAHWLWLETWLGEEHVEGLWGRGGGYSALWGHEQIVSLFSLCQSVTMEINHNTQLKPHIELRLSVCIAPLRVA